MLDLLLQPHCISVPDTMHGSISLKIDLVDFNIVTFSSYNGNRFTSKVMGYMRLKSKLGRRSNLIKCENPFGLIEDIDSNCLLSSI